MLVLMIIHLLIVTNLGCCDSNAWRGIKPLETTRSEVEKIVGKPVGSFTKHAAAYETNEGRVSVTYSDGGCGEGSKSWWNVPDLTVLQITFYPKEKKPFADLSLDKTKFKEIPDHDILHLVEFVSTKAGISVSLDTDTGMVTGYRYFPNDEQNEALSCKKNNNPKK